MTFNDTICAVATATGGAIGIIRVSGERAIDITDRIFTPADSQHTPLAARKAYSVNFGHIINEKNEIVDEVLVSIFKAPHSYTGENSVEISCHGSMYILQEVTRLLIDNGCRSAHPGEYTQRAFLNGKMDLSQAEAVADLIASSSATTHRMAMNQMRGAFSHELTSLKERLLHLTSLIELELDFSDHEELEFADRNELLEVSQQIHHTISKLAESFKIGNAIKNGVPVAIVGETNVGKSTLLNALVGEDKAIVSDIHGTTRDVIEDTMTIGGITFRFMDTAGIRDTDDKVENIGIEKTFEKINQASIVIWMRDVSRHTKPNNSIREQIGLMNKDQHLIVVNNKTDLVDIYPTQNDEGDGHKTDNNTTSNRHEPITDSLTQNKVDEIWMSAKNTNDIDRLKQLLVSVNNLPSTDNNSFIVTNARHYEALKNALSAIKRVIESINIGISTDLVSQDLRECIHHLADITGEVNTDMTLHNIFKNFCIGK